ncbi:MAG: NUDIX hydrolase [Acidimicrobiia bacterium]
MREWLVGGGLVVGERGVLLVENLRRDGARDWSPPGGVIDDDETVVSGLTREVEEETGVRVRHWNGPVYEVEVEAPGLGWRLRVEAHLAVEFTGDLRICDPDGIVVDAAFVAPDECDARLAGCQPWVREPLGAWLAERWGATSATHPLRRFRYLVEGEHPRRAIVSRR